MAENKENLKVSTDVEKINDNYDTAKKELDNLDEGKFYEKHEDGKASGNISIKLNEAKDKIFTEFKNKNEGIEAKSLDELDEEARKNYDEFLKSSEEVQKIYDEVDEEVKKINKDRNVRLQKVAKEIDNLAQVIKDKLQEVEANITKNKEDIENKQKEIDALKPDDFENEEKFKARQQELLDEMAKLNDKKATLENDKKRLEYLQGEITREVTKEDKQKARENNEKVPEDGLRQQLAKSLDNQKLVRAGAQEGAKEIFGVDRVNDDFGLSDLDKEDIEKEKAAKEEQQQGVPVQGGQQADFIPQQEETQPNIQEEPDEEEIEDNSERINFFFAKLGYNEGDKLTGGRSVKLLENYINNELTDSERLEMLAYPECKKVIIDAMESANKSLNPLNRIRFNKTRKELVNLSDRMVIKSIQELGEEIPEGKENIEQKYYDIRNSYNEARNKIEERLNDENLSREQRKEIKSELKDLDKKYASIHNLEDYRDKAIELERKRDAIIDKISGMFSTKDKLTGVKKDDKEKADQTIVTDMYISKLEKELEDGQVDKDYLDTQLKAGLIDKDRHEYYSRKHFAPSDKQSWKEATRTVEGAAKSEAAREAAKRDGKDVDSIDKSEPDRDEV